MVDHDLAAASAYFGMDLESADRATQLEMLQAYAEMVSTTAALETAGC